MKRGIITILLLAAIMTVLFSGCGSAETEAEEPTSYIAEDAGENILKATDVIFEESDVWAKSPAELTVSLKDGESYSIKENSFVLDQDNFVPEYSVVRYPVIEFSDKAANKEMGKKINQIFYETAMLNYSDELGEEMCATYSCRYYIAYADEAYISIYYFDTLSSGMSRALNFENAVTISLKSGDKVSLEDFGDAGSIMQEISNYSGIIYAIDGLTVDKWEEEKERFIELWLEDENSSYYGYYLYDGRVGFFFDYYRTGREKINLEFSGIVDSMPATERDTKINANELGEEADDQEREPEKELLFEDDNWTEKPKEITISLKDGESYSIKENSFVLDQDNFVPKYSAVRYPVIEFSDEAANEELGKNINEIFYETAMLNYIEEAGQEVNATYSCRYFIAYADEEYISIYYFETRSAGMSRPEIFENAVTISLESGNIVSLEDFGDVDNMMQEINNYTGTIYSTDDYTKKEVWTENKEEFIEEWLNDESSLYHRYYLYDGRVGFLFYYYRDGRVYIGLEFSEIVDY